MKDSDGTEVACKISSSFDYIGPFESSLRSYNEDGYMGSRRCLQGVHDIGTDCTCDSMHAQHECLRPHCSNDIPMDPCCKLSYGTPYGVPVTSWSSSRCHNPPPDLIPRPVSAFSVAVTERLFNRQTQASKAKNRSIPEPGDKGRTEGRLTFQFMGNNNMQNGHDASRRDGASPVPGDYNRRARSVGVRNNRNAADDSRRSMSSSAAVRSHRVKVPSSLPRSSESEFSSTEASSSTEGSPLSTPVSTPSPIPLKPLSPKNSGAHLVQSRVPIPIAKSPTLPLRGGATPRPGVARFSAVFASCGNHKNNLRASPLNKSASDGVERLRGGPRKQPLSVTQSNPTPIGKPKNNQAAPLRRSGSSASATSRKAKIQPRARPKQLFNKPPDKSNSAQLRHLLSKVASDSKVDELLKQAHMVLNTLTPEQAELENTHRQVCKGKPAEKGKEADFHHRIVGMERAVGKEGTWPHEDVRDLGRKVSGGYLARTDSKKENGKSYKDLSQILKEKIEELDSAMARSDEQLALGRLWLDAERVWLVHKGGFCAARQLPPDKEETDPLPEGRTKIKLEHNEEIIEVDEDDVEKANPPPFSLCEDLAHLRHLNESSVLHTLRQRFGSNLIHTNAGNSMVVLNPANPLAIYSEKVIQMFKGCKAEDMPPHIYSCAQSTYRDMISSRKDQSIVFLGRSGSGKTTNFRHVLHYLALAAGSPNKVVTVEKLNAISTLLEAFGNARTALNTNASRFTEIFSMDFDHSGQVVSAAVQIYMPEKIRVVRRPEGEPNYHIFYQLLSGADDELKTYLMLENLSSPNLFMTPLQRNEDKQRAGIAWARIRAAMDILQVSPAEQKSIWSVLASIYHLGMAGSARVGSSQKFHFAQPLGAQRAAKLLGTSQEELARAIFSRPHQMGRGSVRGGVTSPDQTDVNTEGQDALDGMAQGLYSEAFNAVVALINRCISTTAHTANSILVIDSPGFQNPQSSGRSTQSGASFSDLCHNYAQERLQMLFHDVTFTQPHDRYTQEHIELGDAGIEVGTPAPLISLIDRTSNNVMRSSQSDLRDKRGLLWLLDEECLYPGATDQSFLERLYSFYGDREHSTLLKKGPKEEQFTLEHFQGTNPVTYSTNGWLKESRENQICRQAQTLLQESNKENLSRLFVFSRGPVTNTIGGSCVGIEGSVSLRRASSIRRAFTTGTAGIKRKSLCLQVKFTIDGIIESLRRTRLRFVHCLLPQHNSGLCDLKGYGQEVKGNKYPEEVIINVPLLRSQIRGCQILDSLRLHKQGYPEHMSYSEFRRKFSVLAPVDKSPSTDRCKVEALLSHIELDHSLFRMGLSQIFFRTGTIARLEEQRDAVLTDVITRIQARARGLLARRRLRKRKVQETAIRCIQKNVRKFMAVRDWPWWRLLIRVTPLLDVHRTEEELKTTKDELETLRAKLTKLEKERNDLKHENEKQESRLSELSADLAEEQTTSQLAGERLEAEQTERLKLEKQLNELQLDMKRVNSANEQLELERSALRSEVFLNSNNSLECNGDVDSDSSLYKRKYEWSLKEMDILKKQFKQQKEDDVDQLMLIKKQMDKKVSDAYEETDEQRQVVAQMKKKCQRLQAEMNDLKILLEEQTARNNLLEKKQRKFDQDLSNAHEEHRNERLAKDKIQREKDQVLAEKYSYETEVATLKLELDLKEERINSLTRELNDLNFTGKAEEEVALLKKAKHDLELRVKDQEEELDDLAGQVQLLEQCKTRLEMSNEQSRKEMKKELGQREEEVEEIRVGAQKKIKSLESQLEIEHEERTQLLRDKHELERRLLEAQDRSSASTTYDEEAVHRLKKDLKKTKALLRDTQTMLDKSQAEGSTKLIVRQLKTQLEDAEFAKTAAIKARQSYEADFTEMQIQLEEVNRQKKDSEDRLARVNKEKAELQIQLEESEEEVSEVMKKYKATVSQLSVDQITIAEQTQVVAELEHDKQVLQERLNELTSKVEVLEGETANIHTQRRLQMKIKELESKLELESTTKTRLEGQISRLKDQVERLISDCESLRSKESQAYDVNKRTNRLLRESKEEHGNIQQKYAELQSRKQEIEKQLEVSQSEVASLKADLRLAFKRIEDLQQALQGEISTDEDSDVSDSDSDTSLSAYLNAAAAGSSLRQKRIGLTSVTSTEKNIRTSTTTTTADTTALTVDITDSGDASKPEISCSPISEDLEDDYRESYA